MKKVLAVLIAALVAAPLFAQNKQDAKQIKERLQKIAPLSNPYVENATDEKVIAAFKQFQQEVGQKNYYDYDAIFQSMDKVRVAYMNLHKYGTLQLRAQTAYLLNEPFRIELGETEITLPRYINMESINLKGKEPQKFEAFRVALEEDLALAEQMAQIDKKAKMNRGEYMEAAIKAAKTDGAFKVVKNVQVAAKDIAQFNYPKDGTDTKAISDITQVITINIMDDYNLLREKNINAAHVMGAYIAEKDFITKDGKKFRIGNFIEMFAGNVPSFTMGSKPLYNELSDFNDHLREDVALANK